MGDEDMTATDEEMQQRSDALPEGVADAVDGGSIPLREN